MLPVESTLRPSPPKVSLPAAAKAEATLLEQITKLPFPRRVSRAILLASVSIWKISDWNFSTAQQEYFQWYQNDSVEEKNEPLISADHGDEAVSLALETACDKGEPSDENGNSSSGEHHERYMENEPSEQTAERQNLHTIVSSMTGNIPDIST